MLTDRAGLVSVSFRSLSPEEIIVLAKENHLSAIEWGGDIHVPAGDLEAARRVGEMTRAAGLRVAAYGSYYRIGTYGEDYRRPFLDVLDTAVALGATVIRLWAHNRGSRDVPAEDLARITAESKEISALAAEKGCTLTLECHNKTLTDDYHSALDLLAAVDMPNFRMYWQPNQRRDHAYNLEALKALLPYVVNLHVFHWIGKGKFPLEEGRALWQDYLACLLETADQHDYLLEFMPDGLPETLPRESKTLLSLLSEVG